MDIIELDDAIPPIYQDQIEAQLTSTRMSWFFHEDTARSVSTELASSYGGFSHIAYHARDNLPSSPLHSVLVPVLFILCDRAKLPLNALMRIRIGLNVKGPAGTPHHNPHVDFFEPHLTALYYVNDCDGDTFLFDETFDDVPRDRSAAYINEGRFTLAQRISPKKGRLACFDGRHYHASTHPLQASHRIVVTFNFK